MKFLVDAQLPKALASLLVEKGFDALHTSQLPNGNDSTDEEIMTLSLRENRIVISKDSDFYNSFTSKREPFKLLHVKTGNIQNSLLIELFDKNFVAISQELENNSVVQISRHFIISIQS